MLRRVLLFFGLAVGACMLFAPLGSMIYFREYLGDYRVFWAIGQVPIKLVWARFDFAYPPSAMLLIKPFGLIPLWPSLLLWSGAGALSMTLAARRMIPVQAIALGFVTCAGVSVLIGGQTSLFVGALIIAGLTSTDPRWRGAFLAMAAVIKPQSLLAAPVALIARRDWRAIAWAVGAGLLIVAVSALVFGPIRWIEWLTHLGQFKNYLTSRGIDRTDVGLYGLAVRAGLPGWAYMAGIPLGLVSGWLVFSGDAPVVDRYAAFACSTVLMSPYTLGYDLAGLSLAAVAMLLDRDRSPWIWVAAAMIISGALSAPGILVMACILARESFRRRGTD